MLPEKVTFFSPLKRFFYALPIHYSILTFLLLVVPILQLVLWPLGHGSQHADGGQARARAHQPGHPPRQVHAVQDQEGCEHPG